MSNKLKTAVAIIIGLISIIGSVAAYDARVAKQADLQLLANRLEQKIIADQIYQLQRRVWMLEDRYGGPGVPIAPVEVRAEYRELKHTISRLQAEQKK